MAFREIMWNMQREGRHTYHPLTAQLQWDKDIGVGCHYNQFGDKYYIPADAKIGGL